MLLSQSRRLLAQTIASRERLLPLSDAVRVGYDAGVLRNPYRASWQQNATLFSRFADPLDQQSWSADQPAAREAEKAQKPLDSAEEEQLRLFTAAHTAEGGDAGLTPRAVNVTHIEGVVSAAECGYLEHHSATRRVVTVADSGAVHHPLVQLWLNVLEGGTYIPLAARCGLSASVVDAHWRREVEAGRASETDASPEQRLLVFSKWVECELEGKRIVISGQLRMMQQYDSDLQRTVCTPMIELPTDGLRAAYHIL